MAACGGGGADVPEGAVVVRMLDNVFDGEVVELSVGDSVAFVNEGAVPHNAIAVDGSFDSSVDGNEGVGDAFVFTVDQPGTYDYYCSLHAIKNGEGDWQGMVGTLVVGEGEASGASEQETAAPAAWTGTMRGVPGDYPNIQSAVDAAEPGDLVLIEPGVYKEAVAVTTPGLTIRGTDRNAVILDGEFTRENGIVVTADGVAIENMTARNYTVNGFFWTGVTGYRGSYLTAIDDWVYGIYAFDSVDGLFEHSYASGSWDSGFYIGQCDPCNAVITDVLSEFNGLGYSGTNSSTNIYIVNSEWRYNVAGIAPNSLDSELLPPVHDVVVAGNYVHHNGEEVRAPNGTAQWSAYGNGIVLAGARDSVVRNNLLINNRTSGVEIVSMIDKNLWPSGGNEVRDNVIRGSGRADLMLGGPAESRSCFSGNDAGSSVPFMLGLLHNCDGINLPLTYGLAASSDNLGRLAQVTHGQNPQLEHGDAPKPELNFAQIPGGADAPVKPAVDVFAGLDFDPASITTPAIPDGIEFDDRRPTFLGIALDGGFWPVLYGALLWWIPMLTWLLGALWALWVLWRGDRPTWVKAAWSAVVILLPVIGFLLFAALGNTAARPLRRIVATFGSAFVWLAVAVIALLIGGVF